LFQKFEVILFTPPLGITRSFHGEVMKLATCRYIDYPGIGVIDLEVPQLPEKVYKVAAERMFNETMIMETIASVSKALQEYERAGGFTPAVASDATETALVAPEAHVELTTDVPMLAPVNEGREASPPQLVETAEAPAPVAEVDATEDVVVAEGSPPPCTVAVETEGVEARVPGEPVTVVQESATPGTMTRVASPEILDAEETGASLSQGATSCEARTLDLACASWAVTSGLDANSEDDEEVAACHTLECGMTWARDAFDELILPATSVSFLVKDYLLDSRSSRVMPLILFLLAADPRVFRQRRARKVRNLRVKRTQLEMQLVVAWVATAGAVASETSVRASLEAARQSAKDRAISAEAAAATVTTERDSLASRLTLAEAEI
jgi:hypothetical protein